MPRGAGAPGLRSALSALALAALWAAPLSAQQARHDPRLENRMLRLAATQESRGDLDLAEGTLRELLAARPGSSYAVLALERVLRRDGRARDVLPALDEFLAAEPGAAEVWERKLALMAETDSAGALDEAVREWIAADPSSPAPHVAMGGLLAAAGRWRAAAPWWARALERDRASRRAVFGSIAGLGEERGEAAAQVVGLLAAGTASVAALEAGADLALAEGLDDRAVELAARVVAGVGGAEARGFLGGFARRAEDLGRHGSAVWAYGRLREAAADAAERRGADEQLAAAALAVGDTAAALAARARVTGSHAPGSAQKSAAWTEELELRAESPDLEGALESLAAFRGEFPDAPGLDALAAALAARLLGSGMRAEALEVLEGIDGPGAGLERAYLLLENGALTEGAAALQGALPELEPVHATEVLDLILALGGLSPTGGMLAAEVAVARHRGRPEDGARAAREGVDRVPGPDRAAVLALGARAAEEAGMDGEAAAFRRRIVDEHRDAREFPEAALRLARAVGAEDEGRAEAARILEDLITSRPESPVVPGARIELRRLREGGAP